MPVEWIGLKKWRIDVKKKTYIFLALPVLIGVAAFTIFGNKVESTEEQTSAPFVQTYVLEAGNGKHFQLTGTVHARVESDLGFRVSGKIIKRMVDQGQRVTKGQPLMELDAADLELAQKAARSDVVAAKAENNRALQDEKRQSALVKADAVSRQGYELAKALADSTSAKLQAAEASARQADNQVQYATLYADADGVIIDIPADVGQVVAAGQAVIRLAQTDTREAVVFLPETMTAFAEDAKEAFLYSDPSKKIPVKLRELSATADPVTRSYEARYTLEGESSLGATVTVSFSKASGDDAKTYRVPIGALYDNGSGSGIWVVDAKTSSVHTKSVSVIDLGEEYATVMGELSSGGRIVALGAHLLKEDERVRTDNTDTAEQK